MRGPALLRSFVLSVALLFPSLAGAAPLETVVYGIAGAATFGYAPISMGEALGFFKDEGLQLDIVALQGSGNVIPQMLQGTVTMAMLTPDLLIQSHQPGRPNFPIRFVYNSYRRSVWQMVVLEQSPIHSIADLKGKMIGVGALTFANVVQSKALLKQNGIDPSDVSFVAVGLGVPAFEALRRGQVDVLNLFDSVHAALAAQGTKIRELPYPAELRFSSSHGVAFTDKTISERPDIVEKFGRALAKGTIACQANLDACLEAHWRAHPEQKPANANASVRAQDKAILATVMEDMLFFRPGEPQMMGSYADSDWTTTIESLRSGGELKGPDIPLPTLYTNAFVAAYNGFDKEQVVRQAQAMH